MNNKEEKQVMEEAHAGACKAHQLGPKLHDCVERMGYYCIDFAKRCDAYQLHANFIHQPPKPLHPTVAS